MVSSESSEMNPVGAVISMCLFGFLLVGIVTLCACSCFGRPRGNNNDIQNIVVIFPLRTPWYLPGKELQIEGECPVCWESFDNLSEQMDCKRCNYSYHLNCINDQLMCPTCRRRGTISSSNNNLIL